MVRLFQISQILFFVGMVTGLQAASHLEEIYEKKCCGVHCSSDKTVPYELWATVLYLKPDIDDTHYVLSSFNNKFEGSLFPKGKRHQNTTTFNSGYRVEGIFDLCEDTSIGMRLTYFNAPSKSSVSGDYLYDTVGFPGFGAQAAAIYSGKAQSKNSYNYFTGDITYHHSLNHGFLEHIALIAGLHYAHINFKEHTKSSGTFFNNDMEHTLSNNLHRNSSFSGIGPQIGLGYHHLFSRSWTLHAKAKGSLLCGYAKSNLNYVTLRTGPGGVGIQNEGTWRVIPAASTELCINYILDYKCFNLILEFGYELMWYSDCVNKITGLDVAFPGDTIDIYNSFSLQGPCFSVSGIF